MSMTEEIYAGVLPEMKAAGIEDTLENREAFLSGLADGWREDEDFHPLKPFYQLAIALEIQRLRIAIHSR